MKVVVSARKSPSAAPGSSNNSSVGLPEADIDLENPVRTPFATVLANCTTIIVVCPLTPETRNLISTAELSAMRPNALVVNVSRGGVVDESAMAAALNARRIGGYATDVFATEPAFTGDTDLIGQLNHDAAHFVATPHVAWFSGRTITNLTKILKDNVEMFMAGTPQNLVL
jgi:lactate dehydrogenase-like 2-hydroxyacid dehydrogenase